MVKLTPNVSERHKNCSFLTFSCNLFSLAPWWNKLVTEEELSEFPTFWNLRSLKMDKWCLSDNFKAVANYLRHSPNLEMLTLRQVRWKSYNFWMFLWACRSILILIIYFAFAVISTAISKSLWRNCQWGVG